MGVGQSSAVATAESEHIDRQERRPVRLRAYIARPGGMIVIEHGEWQGETVRAILTGKGWRAASTHQDLTTRDRATAAIRP